MSNLVNDKWQAEGAAVKRMMSAAPSSDELDLSIGEPDQPVPSNLIEEAIATLGEGKTGYTEKPGLLLLREKLAALEPNGVNPVNVIVTVGGTEAVAVAIESVCSSGDSILIPDPAWPNYRVLAQKLGIHVLTYRQGGVFGGNFFDYKSIERSLSKGAKLVIVNSPSNPMGTVANAEGMRKVYELACRYDAYVLSDEAYRHIAFMPGNLAVAMADVTSVAQSDDRILTARTFSKTFSMTGLRLGYLIVPDSLVVRATAIHGSTVGCASRTAQMIGVKALDVVQERGNILSEVYRQRFELAREILGDLFQIGDISCAGGFYLWLAARNPDVSASTLVSNIRKRGIVVSSGNVYSVVPTNAIRVALTASSERLRPALAAIREVLVSA